MLLLLAGCTTFTAGRAPIFQSDRISVVVTGSGPDVVLVHGLSSSRRVWDGTTQAVPGYRYHLVQLNGFAGHPPGGNAMGPVIAASSEEIARYIRESRLERPAIIGHSMGGTIALSVAARHDLVSKVMVVDMLPFLGVLFAPPGASRQAVSLGADAVRARALNASPDERQRTIESSMATMVRDEDRRAAAIADALSSDRETAARAFHELIVTDLRPELSRITVPVTILYVKTPNVPLSEEQFDALYTASYAPLPRRTLKRIPDSYHFVMFDQAEQFATELRRFLNSLSAIEASGWPS
jgi:pimeloyl-ACP methyl ester carboxylesterase